MLILIRHGESVANAQGLLLGRTDAELTQKGMAQASSVGQLLRDPVLGLRTSPLSRARDTAALMAIDVPIEVDDRWVEVDYGEYECQPLSDIPADIWREWQRDPGFRPAGGESLAEVDSRVAAACDELFTAEGLGGPRPARRHRRGEPCHADQGGRGLGPRHGCRAVVAAASADGLGDPDRVGNGHPVLHGFNELAPNRDVTR